MKKKSSWFNFSRQPGSSAAANGPGTSSAANATGVSSSSSAAAASMSERMPMLKLFAGRSDADGEGRGLLSGLVKNK